MTRVATVHKSTSKHLSEAVSSERTAATAFSERTFDKDSLAEILTNLIKTKKVIVDRKPGESKGETEKEVSDEGSEVVVADMLNKKHEMKEIAISVKPITRPAAQAA
jgi:hypothetical protein